MFIAMAKDIRVVLIAGRPDTTCTLRYLPIKNSRKSPARPWKLCAPGASPRHLQNQVGAGDLVRYLQPQDYYHRLAERLSRKDRNERISSTTIAGLKEHLEEVNIKAEIQVAKHLYSIYHKMMEQEKN